MTTIDDRPAFVEVIAEGERTNFPKGIPGDIPSVAETFDVTGRIEGTSLVRVRIPASHIQGLYLANLGTVYAFQSRTPTTREPRDHFSVADELLHFDTELPTIAGLPQANRRLPWASASFWSEAEFPRDTALASHMLRYLKTVEVANGATNPYVAERMTQFALANLYRMFQLQGCVDRPSIFEQKDGRMPQENRPESALRDQLSYDWDRTEWPVFIADDTSVLALLEAAETLKELSPGELDEFLGLKLVRLDGRISTVGEALGRLVSYVNRQLQNGDGLVFVHRDQNDSWMTWTDSVLAYQHADGTLPLNELAPVELQGWAHDAMLGMAELLERNPSSRILRHSLGEISPESLRSTSARTAEKLDLFRVVETDGQQWLANGVERTPEGRLKPLQKAHANMGIALNSRWIDAGTKSADDKLRLVVGVARKLVTFATKGGIPTMANGMPGGYHNGAIWPWVQGYIATALAKQGLPKVAATILRTSLVDRWGPNRGFGECIRSDGTAKSNTSTLWAKCKLPNGKQTSKAHPLEQLPEGDQMWTVVAYILSLWHEKQLPHEPKFKVDLDSLSPEDEALTAEYRDQLRMGTGITSAHTITDS